jgi:hypothetical protein
MEVLAISLAKSSNSDSLYACYQNSLSSIP